MDHDLEMKDAGSEQKESLNPPSYDQAVQHQPAPPSLHESCIGVEVVYNSSKSDFVLRLSSLDQLDKAAASNESVESSQADKSSQSGQADKLDPVKTRTPLDLVLVIDISSSMNSGITGAGLEASGYTRYDLMRHAITVVLSNLSPQDHFTVIVFNQCSRVLQARTSGSHQNVTSAKQLLDKTECDGQTNLYDAIDTAYRYLELNPLKQAAHEFVNRHIIVLTDGEPTVAPKGYTDCKESKPYTELIDKKRKGNGLKSAQVSQASQAPLLHMFGITCDSLDDVLLGLMVNKGMGMYGFVSNAAIITPCFINILGQLFHMQYTALSLLWHDKRQDKGSSGSPSPETAKQYGLVLPWIWQQGITELEVSAEMGRGFLDGKLEVVIYSNNGRKMRVKISSKVDDQVVRVFRMRTELGLELLDVSSKARSDQSKTLRRLLEPIVKCLGREMDQSVSSEVNHYVAELKRDVDVYSRVKAEELDKWGSFCVRSLACSLLGDYVTNGYERSFKESGRSGLTRLEAWIEQVELVAKNLAMPNPSIQPYTGNGVTVSAMAMSGGGASSRGGASRGASYQSSQAIPCSAPYYASSSNSSSRSSYRDYFTSSRQADHDDGCLDGDCLVKMAIGVSKSSSQGEGKAQYKRVCEVRMGDEVVTDNGSGVVRCVIVWPSQSLVELPAISDPCLPMASPLRLTAMHPVKDPRHGDWIWPKYHPQQRTIKLSEPRDMYSFLLEKGNVGCAMHVSGYWVVHFAHGSNHPVLEHEFYGTDRIRKRLEELDPQRLGMVRITGAKRDASGLVIDYQGYAF